MPRAHTLSAAQQHRSTGRLNIPNLATRLTQATARNPSAPSAWTSAEGNTDFSFLLGLHRSGPAEQCFPFPSVSVPRSCLVSRVLPVMVPGLSPLRRPFLHHRSSRGKLRVILCLVTAFQSQAHRFWRRLGQDKPALSPKPASFTVSSQARPTLRAQQHSSCLPQDPQVAPCGSSKEPPKCLSWGTQG